MRKKKVRRSENRKNQKRQNRKFFQWFVAPDGGSKNMLAKTVGAESSGGMRGENLQAAVDMSKKCMPYHAVVARNLL